MTTWAITWTLVSLMALIFAVIDPFGLAVFIGGTTLYTLLHQGG